MCIHLLILRFTRLAKQLSIGNYTVIKDVNGRYEVDQMELWGIERRHSSL